MPLSRQSITTHSTTILCYCIIVLHCLLLPHQSMTLYSTPFYATVPMDYNAFVTQPIYDHLRYSLLCIYIIVFQLLLLPHQFMTPYGTPFNAIVPMDCNAFVTSPI